MILHSYSPSCSSSSSVLPALAALAAAEAAAKTCLFLSIDLIPSEPEVKSSRLPCKNFQIRLRNYKGLESNLDSYILSLIFEFG